MSDRTIELVYDDVPPSLNRTGSRGSHWVVRDHKQRWQSIFEGLLMMSALPRGNARLHVTASLRFPVVRERDEGNFRWMLEKALGDALTNGGWLAGDTAKQFTVGAVTFEPATGPHRTTVQIRPEYP